MPVQRPNPLIALAGRTAQPFTAARDAGVVASQKNRVDATTANIEEATKAAQTSARQLAEFESITRGVNEAQPILDRVLAAEGGGDFATATNELADVLRKRAINIASTGGDPSDTEAILQRLANGDFQGIQEEFDRVRQLNEFRELALAGGSNAIQTLTSAQKNMQTLQALGGPDSEAGKQFMEIIRRQSVFGEVGGVPGTIQTSTAEFTPAQTPTGPATLEGEAQAEATITSAEETAKQEAIIAAIPAKVQAQFNADYAADAPQRLRAAADQIARVDSVMEEAELAIDDIDGASTGLAGSVTRKIAGTPAFALARKIETIQANLSFDRIAEMRKNSPTGGALGQVSERELTLLGAAVVALDQANSEEEVRRSFEKVLTHYNNWKGVITGRMDADQLLVEGQGPQESPGQVLNFDAQGNPI